MTSARIHRAQPKGHPLRLHEREERRREVVTFRQRVGAVCHVDIHQRHGGRSGRRHRADRDRGPVDTVREHIGVHHLAHPVGGDAATEGEQRSAVELILAAHEGEIDAVCIGLKLQTVERRARTESEV